MSNCHDAAQASNIPLILRYLLAAFEMPAAVSATLYEMNPVLKNTSITPSKAAEYLLDDKRVQKT